MNQEDLLKLKEMISSLSEDEKKVRDLYLKGLQDGTLQGPPVGYSSIDKPWLRYFTEEEIMGDIPKMTCYETLYNNNKDHLDDKAIEYLGKSYTYRRFFDLIEKTKDSLVASGVKKGDVVTICSITTPEVLALFYALNRIGAIPNFVDLRYPPETLKNYITEAKSDYVFTLDLVMPAFRKIIDDLNVKEVVYINPANGSYKPLKYLNELKTKKDHLVDKNEKYVNWDVFFRRHAEKVPDFEYQKDYPAAIVHTGGTTGVPKGVVISNDAFNSIVYQAQTARTHEHRGWKFLNIMPPFIAYGIGLGLYTPLVLGWETVIIPKFDANDFVKLLSKHKPNGIMGVPAYWFKVMNSRKGQKMDLSFLEDALVGGDKTLASTEERINQFFKDHNSQATISKGYSMTEASALATFSNKVANKPDSVGSPLVKTTIAAFEPGTHNELPTGQIGELCIKSPNMMNEYFENEEETKQVKQMHEDGEWIHSGDLGYVDSDGIVFVEDRLKRMIIRSGFKVFPSEIEKRVLKLDFIDSCAVIGIYDPEDVSAPKVYFTVKPGYEGDKEETEQFILDYLKTVDLPPYFLPVEAEMIDKMPLTLIGKIDYNALKDMHITGGKNRSR